MTTLNPAVEFDADSAASSPRDHFHGPLAAVPFMCSFGVRILLLPHDNHLRYVYVDTRMVALPRSISFSGLLLRLSEISGTTNMTVKYQLPNEDPDALISVTTDEDVENMMEEYDWVEQNQNSRSALIWLFLFVKEEDYRTDSISSLLDDSADGESWFVYTLNSCVWRLEASSMVLVVPGRSVQPFPLYYIPCPVPVQYWHVQVQQVTIQVPYVQPYPAVVATQVAMAYHQVVSASLAQAYTGWIGPIYGVHPNEAAMRTVPEGVRQQHANEAVPNPGGAPLYPVMNMASGDELQEPEADNGAG